MPPAGLRAWVFDPRLLMCSGLGVAASAGHRVTEQQAAERREQGDWPQMNSARDHAAQVHYVLTRKNASRQEVPAAMQPGPGPGPGPLHMLRGFSADESVTKQQLKPGTVRRIGDTLGPTAGIWPPFCWLPRWTR